jgi:tripartite ATP-independent transporter DctM subunit
MMLDALPFILFGLIFALILFGYPVALTLGGVSVLFGVVFLDPAFLNAVSYRIFGIMTNVVLIAVPLFVFMGVMLEKSGLAERMLETIGLLFGRMRGGLAIAVIIVGTLLAASTGIVGATVITMGLISLPTMIKRGYNIELATGTIAASGTLGQIIPPSIVLVLLADTITNSAQGGGSADVGAMFGAALLPGLLLVVGYILYVLVLVRIKPELAPAMPAEEVAQFREDRFWQKLLGAFVLPALLIVSVLGSIFLGIASPTEAAAVGALGATLLTVVTRGKGGFTLSLLKEVTRETTKISTMVFTILMGATVFSLVFRGLGGPDALLQGIEAANLGPQGFLLLVMLLIFLAGFFIDFIEIIFIFVPVVIPIFDRFGMDLTWVGILFALNLQTSFLSPPFGFSLFYLKGVAPPEVTTRHLYRGIVPYLVIQVAFLLLVMWFPEWLFLKET